MKKTVAKEDYLKLIYKIIEEDKKVSVSLIANHLRVGYSSVSNMLKKLKELGWIEYNPYKPIFMTKKGNVIASQIVSKHRLTESFLVNVMGFKIKEVHEIAEEIEHINSPKFFNRMKKIVKNTKTDPHGSKIPNCEF
jgi:DtxR family Mn-dependent transcriptional regulator